jgi:hypothetical protein
MVDLFEKLDISRSSFALPDFKVLLWLKCSHLFAFLSARGGSAYGENAASGSSFFAISPLVINKIFPACRQAGFSSYFVIFLRIKFALQIWCGWRELNPHGLLH